jgi:hypothetical protein
MGLGSWQKIPRPSRSQFFPFFEQAASGQHVAFIPNLRKSTFHKFSDNPSRLAVSARISNFLTLPDNVIGNESTKRIYFGIL